MELLFSGVYCTHNASLSCLTRYTSYFSLYYWFCWSVSWCITPFHACHEKKGECFSSFSSLATWAFHFPLKYLYSSGFVLIFLGGGGEMWEWRWRKRNCCGNNWVVSTSVFAIDIKIIDALIYWVRILLCHEKCLHPGHTTKDLASRRLSPESNLLSLLFLETQINVSN